MIDDDHETPENRSPGGPERDKCRTREEGRPVDRAQTAHRIRAFMETINTPSEQPTDPGATP